MKHILLKTFIFYMLLAQALGNVAYAKHACVMNDSPASEHSMAMYEGGVMPHQHATEQLHEHGDDCVCVGGHQHCSASPSITVNTEITVESLHSGDVAITIHSHPFPAHLTDLIRPPSLLSC